MKVTRCIILLFTLIILPVHGVLAKENKIVRIGVGSLLGGYYTLGLKLCRYISESSDGIKCELVPTTGSLESLRLLQQGKIDFTFALSNLAIDAYNGKGYFAESEPFKDMYQLLRLHDEYFTVIVKDDDKILVFADLEGRKVSNGPPKSDSSTIYEDLEVYYDFKKKPVDIELAHEDYAKEFCKGNIDAVIMMTGHPSALVNFITHACESDFVTVDSDKIELLLQHNPGFHKVTLEKGKYPGITETQETVAVPAIFVAGRSADKLMVERFINYFNTRISRFKATHPILYDLDDDHFTSGFVLPGIDK